MGHCPLADSCLIHSRMQCYGTLASTRLPGLDTAGRGEEGSPLTMWKLWPHLPDTETQRGERQLDRSFVAGRSASLCLRRLQSSPGNLHVGHVLSKWFWQMPQTSSSGRSHRHVATADHFLILTFIRRRREKTEVGIKWC